MVAVTGAGVVCSIAGNAAELEEALRQGRCGISSHHDPESPSIQVAATIRDFSWQEAMEPYLREYPELGGRVRKVLNNNNPSTCLSAYAAIQAYVQAELGTGPRNLDDMGLIVAGSNLDQEFMIQNWSRFRKAGRRMNPKYAITFLDSNQLGSLSEMFAIHGTGCTIGAASASGNAALFNAFHWIRSGMTERCMVVGACSKFSSLELEAFALLGAASSGQFHRDPAKACRPFDRDHEGFVWGEASACLVLESMKSARTRRVPVLGEIVGASLLLDGHHLPDPNVEGEIRAMRSAFEQAGVPADRIGYVNAHGTSSPLGDRTECDALKAVFKNRPGAVPINSTKSLLGHCMSAAGVLEVLSCLIQLNRGFLHPNRNLERPIDSELQFAGNRSTPLDADYALSNGFGFGGINSSLLIRKGRNP